MILTVERHGNQNTHRMRQRGNMEIKNDLIRKCRHKAEIPFTIFVVALIILILVMVIWELFKNIGIAIANDIPIDEDTATPSYNARLLALLKGEDGKIL